MCCHFLYFHLSWRKRKKKPLCTQTAQHGEQTGEKPTTSLRFPFRWSSPLYLSLHIRSYNIVQHTLTKRHNFLYSYHRFIALSRTTVGKFLNSERGRTAATPPNGSSSSMENSLTGIIFLKGTKRFKGKKRYAHTVNVDQAALDRHKTFTVLLYMMCKYEKLKKKMQSQIL